uniref:Zinc finger protein 710 n=1 Tax=Geotrypetes seraphini TaxID=260995 RepID=A0A6P8P330_GEOSA|nr:zinc finger protein 710 [Geotrypetes seraphini]XP_033775379.1 zinc finger protein 710 [Geotrypetes seraphini]XP_033775380.1 zinc finger protein 710 [Geotrypetes seraphini]XP_033775381.1 zinc finger protein 710 [Geotrypetes seraphini]
MNRLMDSGTQTDAVVVLSLAQAAVLGLVSENELFGASISPSGFFPATGSNLMEKGPIEAEQPEGEPYLETRGRVAAEPQEEEALETEKHTRRKKRPPVRLVPKIKYEKVEGEEVYEVALQAAHEGVQSVSFLKSEQQACEGTVQSSTVKMIDLSTFRRRPRRLRHLQGHQSQDIDIQGYHHIFQDPAQGYSEPTMDLAPEGTELETRQNQCNFEPNVPSKNETEIPQPKSPSQMENGPNYMWQESTDFDTDAVGSHMERNKKAQLDRLDINVQIDDSYLVEAGDRQKRWQCRLCEKSYTSKYNLVTHILGHSGIKPHSCPHCNKLFKQPSHLQTHLLTHQGTRPHRCEVCNKAFTQTSHLKRHMLLHTDIKPYSCHFCGRGFAYPSELKAHEVKHENGRCHVCVECGLDFATLTQLKRHLSIHQGPTLYQCLECNKSFHYLSQLQNHMLKHQNVRPFVCRECGMEFSQIHHLKQHSLTHKGVKEFKCEVCGREFTLHANMKRHMLIHASVRPFQCHMCFKTFVQKQTLKTHMIVHSPVKPFKCKVCGKSFNRMYNLLGHMHLHAGSKPFKCPYCSSKFNLKGNLSRHMKVKHGVMDISLDSQDPVIDVPDTDRGDIHGQREMDCEENSYNYGELENNSSANALSEQTMNEMTYYNV